MTDNPVSQGPVPGSSVPGSPVPGSPAPGLTSASRPASAVAALVCGIEALALLGFCGFYLRELGRGGSDSPARVVMSIVLIAAFAVALLWLGRRWLHAVEFVRTPTIVWNLLLLPVAWGLVQGGRDAVAIAVGGVALVGLAAAILARPPQR